ncbi:MAG: hypothetical protein ACLQVL_27360 [Terriglobia bacterium]
MRLKKTLSVTIAALALIVAASATAQSKDSANVVLHYGAAVAGTHLASGSYDVRVQAHSPEATVSFLHGKNVVATAAGKLVDRGTTYTSNEVVYQMTADGSRVIQEIRLRGSREAIVFNE